MKESSYDIRFLGRGETLEKTAPTGISLHCHTLHSREFLDFVPYYFQRIPVASFFWHRALSNRKRRFGTAPDFSKGHWQPPLTGSEVVASESGRLAKLGLNAIVSITDHDSIDACIELRSTSPSDDLPISLEWTVPFRNAFFHIGVHNLPVDKAQVIASQLIGFTKTPGEPNESRLTGLLIMLDELPGVLVVLNHPIWDIEMIGQQAHEQALDNFILCFSEWIHAIEVNGFRTWSENQAAIRLAKDVGLPVVSGGDRHCCQPNTMFNVTDATDFEQFVHEIRIDQRSRIVVAPEYNLSLPSRQLASIAQILAYYPEFPADRQLWSDRIFLDCSDGRGLISLTDQWDGRRPFWTHFALAMVRILAHPAMRPFIGITVGDKDIGRTDDQTKLHVQPTAVASITPERLLPKTT